MARRRRRDRGQATKMAAAGKPPPVDKALASQSAGLWATIGALVLFAAPFLYQQEWLVAFWGDVLFGVALYVPVVRYLMNSGKGVLVNFGIWLGILACGAVGGWFINDINHRTKSYDPIVKFEDRYISGGWPMTPSTESLQFRIKMRNASNKVAHELRSVNDVRIVRTPATEAEELFFLEDFAKDLKGQLLVEKPADMTHKSYFKVVSERLYDGQVQALQSAGSMLFQMTLYYWRDAEGEHVGASCGIWRPWVSPRLWAACKSYNFNDRDPSSLGINFN